MKHIKVFDSYDRDDQEKLKYEFKKLINWKFLNKLEKIFTEYEDKDSSLQIKYSVVISGSLKVYYLGVYYYNNDSFDNGFSKNITNEELRVAKNGGLYYRFMCVGGNGSKYMTDYSIKIKNEILNKLRLHFNIEEIRAYDSGVDNYYISYIKIN